MNKRYTGGSMDSRHALANKLVESGVDLKLATIIAIDCGLNLVDRNYLIDMGLKGEKLILAENCIKEFYWLSE